MSKSKEIYKREQFFKRITLIGLKEDAKKWIKWCHENEYVIQRSGPKPISKYRYSTTKFKIIAEKEIK